MKRIVALIIVIIMVFGVVISAVAGLWASRADEADIVYVNWPTTMITDDIESFNEVAFIAQNDGYKSVKLNDDGTATIGLTSRLYQMIEEQIYSHFDSVFQSFVESEDTPYIKEISY